MATDDLCWMSAATLAPAIKRRKISPVEVMNAVLARVERVNPRLNAFVTLTPDQALKDARAAERAVMTRRATLGPLHGVPFSTKDLVITKGIRTTFGTRLFADNVPIEDAPMVERLRAAGAIQLGKTNTPMMGWIGATHNLLFGITRNPWNLDRTPGGSSGGASAAVAAGLGPLAIGTDGGGSIRIPASLAGIYGIKPTFGLIPIYPFSAAWGLSHIGPMTRTVADAALMLNAAAGPDARDPFSLPGPRVDYVRAIRGGVKGLRVAWTADLGFAKVVDPEVKALCERAARRFRELGCRVEEVAPKWPSPHQAWRTMFLGGIAARLGPALRERREDVDPGLAAIADETARWGPTQFVQAWFDRLAWEEHPRRLFERHDLLLTPTIACAAFKVGLDGPAEIAGTPTGIYDWIPFTYPFNMTGHPGASVPCGFTRDELPVGLQILGRRFEDATVLRASAAFEQLAPWTDRQPPL
ncbi:MAG TPA: amidase [Candidatus Dormibacteraeota bacterium]|nr:amidase [Candidatus Dormibacteraeota bacterium]